MATASNNLYEVAVLIDDLKHEEQSTRLNSVRHLQTIAKALGQDRTREELIPFLDETILDDEDDVLLVLAEEIAGLVPYIGGKKHIPVLLKPLSQLAAVEEPSVRAKSIESLAILVEQMSKEHVMEFYVPIVKTLTEKEWYTAREAATSLFTPAYKKVSDSVKAEMRGMFGQLCKDDTALVRKAAAKNIGDFAKVVEPDIMRKEIIPLFESFLKDDQDIVKLLGTSTIITLCEIFERDDHKREMLAHIFTLSKDKAWRIRWSVAKDYVALTKITIAVVEQEDWNRYIKLFVKLMRDEEPEVRNAAARNVTDVAELYKKDPKLAEDLIPAIAELVEDSCDFVRATIASVIFGVAPVFGKKQTVDTLVPFFLALLRDPEPEVRLNLIGKMDALKDTIPVEQLADALLPSVTELARDGQWRIRHSIIEHIPLLAKHLKVETFDKHLVEQCMNWLQDEVFSIREAATNNLKNLATVYGEPWYVAHIRPHITTLKSNTSYLFRMQALRAVESLAPVISQKALSELVENICVPLAADATPNLKFNVAKCFERIKANLSADSIDSCVIPTLKKLSNDADNDVRYFGEKTLELFQAKK